MRKPTRFRYSDPSAPLLGGILALFMVGGVWACGPWFPNWVLVEGDDGLLSVPTARFDTELDRIDPGLRRYEAVPKTSSYPAQTEEVELRELRQALLLAGHTTTEADRICAEHSLARTRIHVKGRTGNLLRLDTDEQRIDADNPPHSTPGLPAEFALYFKGAVLWHEGQYAAARNVWLQLLELPAAARPFKTTWAAYMVARSWEEENPRRAMAWFQKLREFVDAGFSDGLGLAAASLGWEARLHLQEKQYPEALALYLRQYQTGDDTARTSLRWTLSDAMRSSSRVLRRLAETPHVRDVVTAYVIAGGWQDPPVDVDHPLKEAIVSGLEKLSHLPVPQGGWHRFKPISERWLEAMENANVTDAAAERLALTAYQAGRMDLAKRWLARASLSQAGRWLKAKLLLRDGKVDEAMATLAALVREFPVLDTPRSEGLPQPTASANPALLSSPWDQQTVENKVRAEYGAYLVSRREYLEALDCLLRGNHWGDAAYVAERVLTLAELRDYVDARWPAAARHNTNDDGALSISEQIRYLLGRRLYRAGQRQQSLAYYPPPFDGRLRHYLQLLEQGNDSSHAATQRGRALFEAARILRHEGLELIGTETAPDWRMHEGNYEEGVSIRTRAALASTNHILPTVEELQRAESHGVQPNERWHYRYLAAELAWKAAELLPDNSDDKARVLCVGGTWIKNLDRERADEFYKTLVIQCGRTELGKVADMKRWFPLVDSEGNLEETLEDVTRKRQAATEKRERQDPVIP